VGKSFGPALQIFFRADSHFDFFHLHQVIQKTWVADFGQADSLALFLFLCPLAKPASEEFTVARTRGEGFPVICPGPIWHLGKWGYTTKGSRVCWQGWGMSPGVCLTLPGWLSGGDVRGWILRNQRILKHVRWSHLR